MNLFLPRLKQFWDYVEFYRKYPKKLDKLEEFAKEYKKSDSAIIFERVHNDYKKVHPDTDYEPLYQTKNKWRIGYEQKYSRKPVPKTPAAAFNFVD